MIESKELLTKRRIEKLAAQYADENLDVISRRGDREYDVFVSHSSRDVEFIRKVLLFLKYSKGGINGYVDWQDPDMKHETDARTAADLKDRIKGARKVIYVVTTDSLKSVWCCWEIGYADCDKGVDDVAILAIKPNNGRWKNHEYLQQYPWISYDEKEHSFMVTKPGWEFTRIGRWWDRKGENEIDMIAEDELADSVTFYEIKRQKDEISLGLLKQKAEVFLQATHEFRGYDISYKGLSMEDM